MGYIFKSKVDELLGDIEGIKTYINDIIVLSNNCFKDHTEKRRIIFGRLRAACLNVNDCKCSFGLNDISYLGYVITREGIKTDPKKVQSIMDIGRPTTTTETREIIGMLQYYRDLWARQSHVLAPLTETASGPKGRKIV